MWHVKLTSTTVWNFVRSAPLTYLWLAVLLVTTMIQYFAGHHVHTMLLDQSTNLHHLATNPLEVLVASLLWIDGKNWTPYLVLFTLILAPAERWLGHARWLAVGLITHVGATYISEGVLYLLINLHRRPEWQLHARDVGVSYFLVGVAAVLTYRIPSPWRWGYLAGLTLIFGVALVIDPSFTSIGHAVSILLGLACYPLVQRVPHRAGAGSGLDVALDANPEQSVTD